MYAVARLYGVVEEVGFKARLGADIARALGVRLGDGIRVEST
ncbi:MAG: molybdopterin-binding protein, partial [Pyrobaculum sp.]